MTICDQNETVIFHIRHFDKLRENEVSPKGQTGAFFLSDEETI